MRCSTRSRAHRHPGPGGSRSGSRSTPTAACARRLAQAEVHHHRQRRQQFGARWTCPGVHQINVPHPGAAWGRRPESALPHDRETALVPRSAGRACSGGLRLAQVAGPAASHAPTRPPSCLGRSGTAGCSASPTSRTLPAPAPGRSDPSTPSAPGWSHSRLRQPEPARVNILVAVDDNSIVRKDLRESRRSGVNSPVQITSIGHTTATLGVAELK